MRNIRSDLLLALADSCCQWIWIRRNKIWLGQSCSFCTLASHSTKTDACTSVTVCMSVYHISRLQCSSILLNLISAPYSIFSSPTFFSPSHFLHGHFLKAIHPPPLNFFILCFPHYFSLISSSFLPHTLVFMDESALQKPLSHPRILK